MTQIRYGIATQEDIDFIDGVYTQNMAALHGTPRSRETWKALLAEQNTKYYIIYTDAPVGWFRLDREADGVWLGMLQIKPACQRRGIGSATLAAAEQLAREQGFSALGIHTTQDNLPARALYASCGYACAEIGPCTTADGVRRVGYTFRKKL